MPTAVRSSKSGPRGISEAQFKAALKKHAGICSMAAAELGISRSAVTQRIGNSRALQAFVLEIEETLLDAAEAVIADAILKRDRQTTRWYMERKGKRRGYTTRVEQTGPDGAALPAPAIKVEITYVDSEPTPEDEDVI